jgi:anti-sigma28 factor (negative regulator of flagellin synthesis)
MKNAQNEILKAFFMALYQQTEPLSANVQLEFNKIDENFKISDILRLKQLYPPLLAAYTKNYSCLRNHSSQRSKRLDRKPNAKAEKNNNSNSEIDNSASHISDLPDVLKIIDQTDQREILQAVDSVQAIKDKIRNGLSLIAKGLDRE